MFAVGYGANHFVPLLAVYSQTLALSDAEATAIFGVYALGLIPGFLIGGPASDRYGRRRIMLVFAALSLLASAVLITGRTGAAGLYAGRLLTGVVSGTVFTVGTAWVKELSGASAGLAARRAALALTAGFAVGPLVAGVLAQWAPLPTVLPYLVHLALDGIALALLPRAAETRPPFARGGRRPPAAAPRLGTNGPFPVRRRPDGTVRLRQREPRLHHAAGTSDPASARHRRCVHRGPRRCRPRGGTGRSAVGSTTAGIGIGS